MLPVLGRRGRTALDGNQERATSMGMIREKMVEKATKWGDEEGIWHLQTFEGGKIAVRPGRR